MKLRRSSRWPSWVIDIVAVTIILAASPFILGLGAIVALVWYKRRLIGPWPQWHRWFAWYPVTVSMSERRWLEMVERRASGILADTHYRAIDREARP